MGQRVAWTSRIALALLIATGATSCVSAYKQSVGGDTAKLFNKIYVTDFNTAWGATLEALKSLRLDVSNREAGYIQTRFTDNTASRNFIDSFGLGADSYLKAQYRFRVTVGKGYFNGVEAVRVSVLKEQLIQNDVLEGWRPVETDSIEENTLLYRIGRLIFIKTKLTELEEEKTKQEMENSPQL